jgi:hypothetical protein
MAKTTLYSDKHLSIFEDKIQFKSWVLPWGKKDVMVSHIKKSQREKWGCLQDDCAYLEQATSETGIILTPQDPQKARQSS